MKRNKKTTDSVLKDIFDPIQEKKTAPVHPLSEFNGGKKTNEHSEEILKKNLLGSVLEAPEKKIPVPPEQARPPITEPKREIPEPKAETPQPKLEISEVARVLEVFQEPVIEPKAEVQAVPDALPVAEEIAVSPVNEPKIAEIISAPAEPKLEPVISAKPEAPKKSPNLFLLPAISLVLTVSFIAGSAFFLLDQKESLSNTLKTRQKEYASFQKKSLSEKQSTARLKELAMTTASQKQNVLSTLRFLEMSSIPDLKASPALSALAGIQREGVWFESASIKNKKLLIRGFVFSQTSLIKLINELGANPYFKNARVSSIQPVTVQEGASPKFSFEVYADANI